MQVLLSREPLTSERIALLTDDERTRLQQLERALRFGESLGLAESTSFRHIVDRGDDAALQVVIAALPDRLEPLTWWFPIAGRVSYRAYFDAERARRFAASLERDGYDTYVRPALLYSTLGYFDDPVPRGLLSWDEIDVVDVILHELVHETVYAPGDTDYNEALATFVANEATLRFFADRPEVQQEARRIFADRRRFATMLAELSAELEQLYATADSPDDARERREPVFQRYREQVFPSIGWQTGRYAGFPDASLSNAYLVAQQTYLAKLDCFAEWLAALGDQLDRFITQHREHPGERRDDLAECRPS